MDGSQNIQGKFSNPVIHVRSYSTRGLANRVVSPVLSVCAVEIHTMCTIHQLARCYSRLWFLPFRHRECEQNKGVQENGDQDKQVVPTSTDGTRIKINSL